MSKVFINPGHDITYDSGAVNQNSGLREADVAAAIGVKLAEYLQAAGVEVEILQSDNLYFDSSYPLPCVCQRANDMQADIFISLHCNAATGDAQGTETLILNNSCTAAANLANYIQSQIVDNLGTIDRGIKERPNLIVLKHTDMPAVLVEMAFIDNETDSELLANKQDAFAAAIARGVTDAGY